ncbi:MAG: cyclopropane-fatty-acyl-phospholipid synthase family protein [Clostridia bacterium]|jgi:cyclopropane-fatty-acyl-phospholipid synthase|nr:cyclopropane-fatty-acyl-phospholipid synthase family protein [Clostridia bacterium]MCI2014089.1 cyclopropane-fatty-acyl-phospholipid synthase family protein [Clostridia bacterium]
MKNSFLADYLSKIIDVSFTLEEDGSKVKIGHDEPLFNVSIKNPISKTELLKSTSLALGEAYMRGDIELDKDLYYVLNLFLANIGKFSSDKNALKKIIQTSVSKANQKKEVSSHYDIGNDFYKLWLDKNMTYSCAYFKDETKTIDEAQDDKLEHILKKLQLQKGMTLLDIGCGWGSLIIKAAKEYGVKSFGITLSEEQKKGCDEKIKAEGLEDMVTVKIMDYRDLEDSGLVFDRVVSVGMLEHVGRKNYELYLKNVHKVLKDGGLFLLHYISALEEHPGDAWIKKYIFPGGMIPSLREIINLLPEFKFYTLDVESLRRHYNRTLLCWRKNFLAHRAEIEKKMGIEFTRMWDLYLASCAATFNNGIVDLHQILMSKGINNDLPMLRVV